MFMNSRKVLLIGWDGAESVSRFLWGFLDVLAMADAVDGSLYKQKRT